MTGSSLDPLPPADFHSVSPANSPKNILNDAVRDYFLEEKKIKNEDAKKNSTPVADKKHKPQKQNNRRQSITFDAIKAALGKTSDNDEKSVFDQLNERTPVEKFCDLNCAILTLDIQSKKKKLDNRFRELIESYLTAITPLRTEKNKDVLAGISKEIIPYLTELTLRLIFKTIYPDHEENNQRGKALAIEVARLYKQNLLGALNIFAISAIRANSFTITCDFLAFHKSSCLLWKSYQYKKNQAIASSSAKEAFDIQPQTNGSQSPTEHSPTLRTRTR